MIPLSTDSFFQASSETLMKQVQEQIGRHNHEGIVRFLNILIDREPSNSEYRHLRGCSLATLGRREDALTDFNLAIKYRPSHFPSYVERGFTLEKMGNKEEALKDYEQTLNLNPHHAFALCQRAGLYMELGRTQEGLAGYTESLKLKEDPNTYNSRGHLLLILGSYEAATNDFNDSLRMRPNQPQVCAMLQEAQRLSSHLETQGSCLSEETKQSHCLIN